MSGANIIHNIQFEQKTHFEEVFIKTWYLTKQKIWNLHKATHCNKPKYLYVYEEKNEQGEITNELNILFTVIKDKVEFSPKNSWGP